MSIENQILGYFRRVEDIAYLKEVLNSVPLIEFLTKFRELLQSSDHNTVAKADLFFRDAWYRAIEDKEKFESEMFQAGIPVAYQQNVFRQNYWIRRTAVSTLSLFQESWWPDTHLQSAISFCEMNDPLLLAELLKLHLWRKRWNDWSLPLRLTESTDFVVRWSVLELLSRHCIHFPLPEKTILAGTTDCLANLEGDKNVFVAAEAKFLTECLSFYKIMLTLAKSEQRKHSKTLDKSEPKPRFSHVVGLVGNDLSSRFQVDLTLEELHEAIARHLNGRSLV